MSREDWNVLAYVALLTVVPCGLPVAIIAAAVKFVLS